MGYGWSHHTNDWCLPYHTDTLTQGWGMQPLVPLFFIICHPYTVEPLNKGHLGTQAAVPYSEVVPYWEVRDKTVILCTFTASMMYKTHYGVIK